MVGVNGLRPWCQKQGLPLADYNPEGFEDQLQIIEKRSILHILQIQLDLLLHDDVDVIVLRILGLLHQIVLVAELY